MSSELPKGWVLCNLEDCTEIFDSLRKPINNKERQTRISGKDQKNLYPYYGATGQVGYIDDYIFNGDYIALGEDGVPFFDSYKEKAYLLKGKTWVNNHAHVIAGASDSDNRFLCYQLNQIDYQGYVNGATRLKLTQKNMRRLPLKLPPINEQTRIADKLDSLLPKVDTAQTRLEKIPTLLQRFRQAVLAAATSGELTREWSEKNQQSKWEARTLIEVIESKPRNGRSPKGVDYETPVKNLTLSAVTRGYFIEDRFKYVDISIPSDSHLWLKKDDILIQRANSIEYVGVSALYNGEDDKYIYPDLIMKCRTNKEILPKYLHYSLLSEETREYFRNNATGTTGNMPKINQTVVSLAPINLPSIQEQKEIVRRVESLFALADTVEKQYLDARQRTDRLTQSLLAKAFRGELVSQDPNDEPASELLKRIQAEREQQAATKPKRKASTRKSRQSPSKARTIAMKLMDAPENYLTELLLALGGEAHAEVLWKKTELSIDDFYAKLKQEMKNGGIIDDKRSDDAAQRKLKIVVETADTTLND